MITLCITWQQQHHQHQHLLTIDPFNTSVMNMNNQSIKIDRTYVFIIIIVIAIICRMTKNLSINSDYFHYLICLNDNFYPFVYLFMHCHAESENDQMIWHSRYLSPPLLLLESNWLHYAAINTYFTQWQFFHHRRLRPYTTIDRCFGVRHSIGCILFCNKSLQFYLKGLFIQKHQSFHRKVNW